MSCKELARILISVVGIFASSICFAATTIGGPSTGLWAHTGDGGRGFNIDIQGDTMIVTTFVYTNTGQPIWYLSSGTYNHSTGVFESSYDSYSNGQCFGCPPNSPVVHSAAAGQMTIQFHSNSTATLTTPTGALEITKFNYGFGSATDQLFGYWVFSFNVSGLVGGDFIVFNDTYTDTAGNVYAAGYTDDILHRAALGNYSTGLGLTQVAVQSSTDFVHVYRLLMDDHRAFGYAWVLQNSQQPSGQGSPAFGGRLAYRSEIIAGAAQPAQGGASSLVVDQALHEGSEKSAASSPEPEETIRLTSALREFEQIRQ